MGLMPYGDDTIVVAATVEGLAGVMRAPRMSRLRGERQFGLRAEVRAESSGVGEGGTFLEAQ